MQSTQTRATLRRTLNLPLLVLYGLGTTIGAGIYALIGEIAGVAGRHAPWAFLLASVLAAFTACSFAELSVRYPRAAGAALYTQSGFGSVRVGQTVGLLVALAGIVSSAALMNGFVGYLNAYLSVTPLVLIGACVVLLTGVAVWGVTQSVIIAGLISVVEVGGLLWIVFLGADRVTLDAIAWPAPEVVVWAPILWGGVLAFYAYIGFEDLVEVVEEVKGDQRTLPWAILLTLAISSVIYVLLVVTAIATLGPEGLSGSSAPMAALYFYLTHKDPVVISVIGIVAIVNGALIQIIMASRVLYGLAARDQLPAQFAVINPRTQTPLFATLVVGLAVFLLAAVGDLAGLAQVTSTLMLAVFALVNLALFRVKGRDSVPGGTDAAGVLSFPRWLSLVGCVVCVVFVVLSLGEWITAA
jgi:APA family basic amino acid/polyamine antiporter